ncbi:RHS repeat domain-containing protein [Lysobacter sp. CA199]|uniref:RHS repeat domain-containing protein n=1 Tax=Lysobacter sp. CA199 TaxID=3455608 RepID=UPI003F8D5872
MKWIFTFVATAIFAVAASTAHAQTVVEYIHTDALGSPVAVTDVNQNVIERTEYEPYGAQINRPVQDGPGYTAHVSDAATGLSYMQQRYYDPDIGRFLSLDPVAANAEAGASFNRYWYANSNPYKFTDPDGRQAHGPNGTWNRPDNSGMVNAHEQGRQLALESLPGIGDAIAISKAIDNPTLGNIVSAGIGLLGPMGDRAAPVVRELDSAASRSSQIIYRQGDSAETATRLERKSMEAEASSIRIHGVSGSTTKPGGPCSSATCGQLEAAGFKVHDTPVRGDKNHKTIEMPKPVTKEDAKRFNRVLGR